MKFPDKALERTTNIIIIIWAVFEIVMRFVDK